MTLNSAPWAIDGARSPASLARLASYAGGGGQSGIVQPLDMRVRSLSVPGNGLRIDPGACTILNGYLSNPDESYVVSNPGTHTVLAADMPAAQGSLSYYLVCVVVGDPEFNQTGHPFMPAGTLDPQLALSFQYNRIVLLPCNANTTTFEALNKPYPGYALARLEVPANTTTIQQSMITDLRALGSPRESSRMFIANPYPSGSDSGTLFSSADFVSSPFQPTVNIPRWATYAEVVLTIAGISHFDPLVIGETRIVLAGTPGASIPHELQDTSGAGEHINLTATWAGDVSGLAGTAATLVHQNRLLAGTGRLVMYAHTTVLFDVRFSERAL